MIERMRQWLHRLRQKPGSGAHTEYGRHVIVPPPRRKVLRPEEKVELLRKLERVKAGKPAL